jgi:hypothetical protein
MIMVWTDHHYLSVGRHTYVLALACFFLEEGTRLADEVQD